MIDKTVTHYNIIEKLGEGGMGIVYKAHDTLLDRTVALKFLPNYLISDNYEKERFYHEARAAASLMHPNVTVIHEICEYDGRVFISMEYVEGETLKQIIEKKNEMLTIEKVLDIMIQTCEGLRSAHEKNIIHRDIKSDNIMLTPGGQVKIMDFGLAKMSGASRLTKTGTTLGTAAYMSPEQAKGMEVDHRSDIFSLGVVLYELLTTRLPFSGDHQAAVMYALMNEYPPPAARYNDKVSPELERIISKALAKERDERYQHTDDLLADIRREKKKLEYAERDHSAASSLSGQSSGNKKISLKLILPAAAVIILVVLFLILKPFGTAAGPDETLSPGAPDRTLAVMYFENIPDPKDADHTGEMLTNLLITSLSQIKGLEVISRERLLDIQKELGHTESKVLSPEFAGEVANHAGVGTMLIGSILQKSPALAVTARLIDVKSGRIIRSEQVKNFPPDKLFSLVDSITYLLKDQLYESGKIRPVADVTTESTEAYRAYVEGLDLMRKYLFADAEGAFKRAAELDPDFAMAYYFLGLMKAFNGKSYEAAENFDKAEELADNVSEKDRLLILTMKYGRKGETYKEEKVLKRLVTQYPHEIFPYVYLLYLYNNNLFQSEKAYELCLKGLKINPASGEIWNILAYSCTYLNRKQEALKAVNNYIKLSPAEPNPYDTKGEIYAWFGDYDSSRISYNKAVSLRRDFASGRSLGRYAVLNGRYKEAADYFRRTGYETPVIEIHKGELRKALDECRAASNYSRAIHLSYETGNYAEMLKLAHAYSDSLKSYQNDKIYGRDYIIWALVKNKKIPEAESLLSELKAEASYYNPRFRYKIKLCSALVKYEEEKYSEAVKQFEDALNMLPPVHEPNYFYAVSLLKIGNTAEAMRELRKIENRPGRIFHVEEVPGAMSYWPIQNVKAHYWLGKAYDAAGKNKESVKEHKRFLEIWKDADFNSPELTAARTSL